MTAETTPTPATEPPLMVLPRTPVTWLVLAACVVVSGWEFQRYGLAPTVDELVDAGGITRAAWEARDWRAIVLSNFLHGGVLHLLMNLFVVVLMGRQLERAIGSWRVGLIVLAAVVSSAFGATHMGAASSVTIGASGIALALVGAAAACDPRRETQLGSAAVSLLVLNAFFTFVIPNVSVGGHLGGLVAGAVVALATGGPAQLRRRGPAVEAALAAQLAALEAREQTAETEEPAPSSKHEWPDVT